MAMVGSILDTLVYSHNFGGYYLPTSMTIRLFTFSAYVCALPIFATLGK